MASRRACHSGARNRQRLTAIHLTYPCRCGKGRACMQSPHPPVLRRLKTRMRIAVSCSVQTTQFPHSLQDDLNLGGHGLHSPLLLKLRGASQCVAPSSHLRMDTSANGYQADIGLPRHEPGVGSHVFRRQHAATRILHDFVFFHKLRVSPTGSIGPSTHCAWSKPRSQEDCTATDRLRLKHLYALCMPRPTADPSWAPPTRPTSRTESQQVALLMGN